MTNSIPTLSTIHRASRREIKIDRDLIIAAVFLLSLFAADVALVLWSAPSITPDALFNVTT